MILWVPSLAPHDSELSDGSKIFEPQLRDVVEVMDIHKASMVFHLYICDPCFAREVDRDIVRGDYIPAPADQSKSY